MLATPLRLFLKSKAIAKICPELRHQFLLPVAGGGKAAVEEAQNSRFFYKAQAADEFAVAV